MDTLEQPDVEITQTTTPSTTPTTTTDIQAAKSDVDAEYAAKPHGGSKTPWIILGLAIVLLIIFAIALIVFFLVFNPPEMHEIAVANNCSENINVLFGVINPSGGVNTLPVKSLAPSQVYYYKATPGTSIVVQGYRDGDTILTGGLNPFTTLELSLGGEGFSGKHQITDGNGIITDVKVNTNRDDQYGVSLQGGYNIPIAITAATNPSGCVGPTWNHMIQATGANFPCPPELQAPGTGSNYQVCMNPCTSIGTSGYCCTSTGACSTTGGCEQLWDKRDYYTVFSSACPNCMITNCDEFTFTCATNSGLTQYVVTFCPSLS